MNLFNFVNSFIFSIYNLKLKGVIGEEDLVLFFTFAFINKIVVDESKNSSPPSPVKTGLGV